MKALVFDRVGDPATVLELREKAQPDPGRGWVRVRMLASPINPSDLMFVRGAYGRMPKLPATPGFEGVGVVEANGGGFVGRLRLGKRVAVLNSEGGNWQDQVVVPAKRVVPVPEEISDERAASFFVNPASAVVMTRYVLKAGNNGWLVQSAAGSSVGRMVIRLGKRFGFRTINIVRRKEQADELRQLGADQVVLSRDDSISDRIREITDGGGAQYGLDAVGGTVGTALINGLARGGRLLLYGTLSGDPISLNPRSLMVQGTSVQGFWLSNWTSRQTVLTMLKLFRQLGRLVADGTLSTRIAATYPLEQFRNAIREAETKSTQGKVILRIGQR
jgi:NADPH:quinone reductase-like Zn-dependent oxidoreductase